VERTGDIARGEWLVARRGTWGSIAGIAATGFEAYARVLHPFDAERGDVTERWRWAEVARRTSVRLHPLVASERMTGFARQTFPDGWSIGYEASLGFDEPEFAALVELLRRTTGRADDVTVGIWHGYGRVVETGCGPNLELPNREYVLLAGTLDDLLDPGWGDHADIGWDESSRYPGPDLIWPADHAWLVASDVDLDWTVVAGPRELVDAVLAEPRFEAFEVGPDGIPSPDNDPLNPR
jgi:hypothetical protein